MTYGGTVPTITPSYAGFMNGDTASSLTHAAHLLDDGHQREPGLAARRTRPRARGASDPNYTIAYVAGATTVTPAPIAVAVSGSQANGGSPSFAGTDAASAFGRDGRHERPDLQPGHALDAHQRRLAVRQLHAARPGRAAAPP